MYVCMYIDTHTHYRESSQGGQKGKDQGEMPGRKNVGRKENKMVGACCGGRRHPLGHI